MRRKVGGKGGSHQNVTHCTNEPSLLRRPEVCDADAAAASPKAAELQTASSIFSLSRSNGWGSKSDSASNCAPQYILRPVCLFVHDQPPLNPVRKVMYPRDRISVSRSEVILSITLQVMDYCVFLARFTALQSRHRHVVHFFKWQPQIVQFLSLQCIFRGFRKNIFRASRDIEFIYSVLFCIAHIYKSETSGPFIENHRQSGRWSPCSL